MMKKSYSSLPRGYSFRRRCWVRCGLSMEASELPVEALLTERIDSPEEFVALAGRVCHQLLDPTPRFRDALREYAAQRLVETVVEGLYELRSRQILGFSVCPLVTESVRFDDLAQVDIVFCAAILTLTTSGAGEGTRAHQCYLGMYRTYYQEILVKYVRRRLEALLDPAQMTKDERFETTVIEQLGGVLLDLRRCFPLEPYQTRLKESLLTPASALADLRRLCRDMKDEARRSLKI